jgi:hypothetical protein
VKVLESILDHNDEILTHVKGIAMSLEGILMYIKMYKCISIAYT